MNPLLHRKSHHEVDLVIIGGGIAGLWLLNRLVNKGYDAILLEAGALGNGQSIASQGIIHGGLKYALHGSLAGPAQAIASMPGRWRACLTGAGDVDLRGCRVLSPCYYMWSDGGYRSRLKTFLGSRTLRGRIELVPEDDYPSPFSAVQTPGSLYRLEDFVIDAPSLLSTLAGNMSGRIYPVDADRLQFPAPDAKERSTLVIGSQGSEILLHARRILFTAGEGNQLLMQRAGLATPSMQTRPLNMVMLHAHRLPETFVHCIGDSFSLTPLLTITSHCLGSGERVWYLGGELAESGVGRSDPEQIEAASILLGKLFPAMDLSEARWACLRINRAEGLSEGRHRPDSVFYRSVDNYIVAWPTKFTLSPALADEILAELDRQGVTPVRRASPPDPRPQSGSFPVAATPWEVAFGGA